MRILYFLSLFLCVSLSALAQKDAEVVSLYATTDDFVAGNKKEALLEVRKSGAAYFFTKNFLDIETKKKVKGGRSSWAIKRGEDYYFNMMYSDDVINNVFVKLEVVGRYCLAILDRETLNEVRAGSVNPYGGSALGLLANSSITWNKSMKDSTDEKRYIIFIDTSVIAPFEYSEKVGSRGSFLRKKKVEEMMKSVNMERKARDLSFEEVMELIKDENAKSL